MAKMSDPVSRVITALERCGCSISSEGDGIRTNCPSPNHAHGNKKSPALSVSEGSDGRALLYCHAGCSVDEITGAIGLEPTDLFPAKAETFHKLRMPKGKKYIAGEPPGKDGVDRFPYRDTSGKAIIYVQRIDRPDGKTFRQYASDDRGWHYGLGKYKDKLRPLFRLPVILDKPQAQVVLHEGEKAAVAAAMARLSGIHTTTIGGSGNGHKTDLAPLAGRDVVIVPDSDAPGEKHARQLAELASKAGAKSVRILRLPGLPEKGDVVEWIAAGGNATEWESLIAAIPDTDPANIEPDQTEVESLDDASDRLAALSPLEYDRVRQAEAKALGVRISTLDAAVTEIRKTEQEQRSMFAVVEPWPDHVDGNELLGDIKTTIQRYIVMSKHAPEAVALWVLNTYVHDASYFSPILLIASPEKRSGKSTLLSLLATLCTRSLLAANISPAAVYRAIEQWQPTLLIDEADTFLKQNDDMAGVINSGHTKTTAFVIRCDGDANEPKRFSTWCAKVIAGIGSQRDTLEDRSIPIPLRRKLPDEQVSRLRLDRNDFENIQRRCIRWGEDNYQAVHESDPATPYGLHDRAADNWAPLLAIADLCGWREKAELAALALSGDDEGESINTILLTDIRDIFKEQSTDRLSSQRLCDLLAAIDDRPWREWSKGRAISTNKLAGRLKSFGIHSKQLRLPNGDNLKGYELAAFSDAFSRYCDSKRYNVTSVTETQKTDNQSVTNESDVTFQKTPKPLRDKGCNDVTFQNGDAGDDEGVLF